ncbi:25081_t:CDS:1, partial [Gigaspora margarita]
MAMHNFDLPSSEQSTHPLVSLTTSSLPRSVPSYFNLTSTNED